jgi:hypothetical protein
MGSKRPPQKSQKSNEMEDREGTEQEVAEVAGAVGLTDHLTKDVQPLTPYKGDREEDEPDRPGYIPPIHPSELTAVEQMAVKSPLEEKMEKMLARLEGRLGETEGTGQEMMALAIMQLTEGLKSFREAQIQSANIIANMQRSTVSPENKFVPEISVYNPRGDKDYPRPLLRCEYFLPWPVKPSSAEELTREEIELLNLVLPGEHLVVRADRTRVKIKVRIITKLDSDEPNRIIFEHDTAFNNDYHRLMPFDWIRQVVESNPKTRAAAKAVLTMEEEEALILARKLNDGTFCPPGEREPVSVGA